MTARRITESYDGSLIAVDVTQVMGRLYVSVNTHEFDTDVDAAEVDRDTLVYLTPAETAELVEALNAALAELAAQNTRPSVSPVAEGRDQTAPGPAHAVRTQRHGRGAASSHARAECSCGWRGELMPIKTVEGWALADRDGERHMQATETAPVGAGAAPTDGSEGHESTSPQEDVDGTNRTTATGPSTPTAGPGRPTLASMLGNARGEMLANSTLIGPAGGEDR